MYHLADMSDAQGVCCVRHKVEIVLMRVTDNLASS